MAVDDGKRGVVGVVVSYRKQPDGSVRIILDDAESKSDTFPQTWAVDGFFTFKDVTKQEFETEFPAATLEDIGAAVIARLLALSGEMSESESPRN